MFGGLVFLDGLITSWIHAIYSHKTKQYMHPTSDIFQFWYIVMIIHLSSSVYSVNKINEYY